MSAARKVRTCVRTALVGGLLVGASWWVGSADNAAHSHPTAHVVSVGQP